VAANGDVRNAFSEAHREAMAAGIAALRERRGRAMIAFFMQTYGTSSELSFFGEDGERHIVKGERGCTQGCALGTSPSGHLPVGSRPLSAGPRPGTLKVVLALWPCRSRSSRVRFW